jgi:hypothetical protein
LALKSGEGRVALCGLGACEDADGPGEVNCETRWTVVSWWRGRYLLVRWRMRWAGSRLDTRVAETSFHVWLGASEHSKGKKRRGL